MAALLFIRKDLSLMLMYKLLNSFSLDDVNNSNLSIVVDKC